MKYLFITVLLVLFVALAVFAGRYPAPGITPPSLLFSDPMVSRIVVDVRLPRIAVALVLGCSLAAAGTVFQMVFANPLVEPGFLGVSQGAAFGAALCIVSISSSRIAVQTSALLFALTGLVLSYLIARLFRYGGWVLRMVLAGIAVSAVFSAGIGLVKLAADPLSQLPDITFWLLGGLWGTGWSDVRALAPPAVLGLSVVWLYRWRLNILSLDDRVAHSLGSSPSWERSGLLAAATLAVSASIAVSGLVGWAGLMVPHVARRLFGTEAGKSLPASMIIGAGFMVACDTLGRTVSESEIPLGIITSIFGACIFLALMGTKPSVRER